MATLKELALGRSDIFNVDPREINIKPGWNARNNQDGDNALHIDALAKSIAAIGVQEPLTVFREDDTINVSDGHCRLTATMLAIKRGAEIKSIPVKTLGRGASAVDYTFQQILNGKPLTPLEQGLIYKRLIGYGWSVKDISDKCGKSESQINATLDLQSAPGELKELVASGKVSSSLAVKTLRARGPTKAIETLNNAVDAATQEGKARATERHIGAKPAPPRKQAMTRLKELFDPSEGTDINDAGIGVSVRFTDAAWAEVARILDI